MIDYSIKKPQYVLGICAICGDEDEHCVCIEKGNIKNTICNHCALAITADTIWNIDMEDRERWRIQEEKEKSRMLTLKNKQDGER